MLTLMTRRHTPTAQRQISRRLQVAYLLDKCVADIETWLSSNRLKLHANKTEFIWLGTRQQLAKLNSEPLQLKGELIMPLEKVRELGVVIDGELNMDAHARNVVRSCYQSAPAAAYHSEITANRRPMHRSRRVHCQSSRLL